MTRRNSKEIEPPKPLITQFRRIPEGRDRPQKSQTEGRYKNFERINYKRPQ